MKGIRNTCGIARRYARAITVALGCTCCFWVVAGADPASQSSHAHAQLRAKLQQIDWGAMWARAIESKLDRWVPTAENARVPNAAIRRSPSDISGRWKVHRGSDGSTLTTTRTGSDSYDITLDTHGCAGWWRLRRTGRYSGGVLVLNRPVEEYFPLVYQKLFAVRIGGSDYLVPDAAVRRFPNGSYSDATDSFYGLAASRYALCRMPAPTPGGSERGQATPGHGKSQ